MFTRAFSWNFFNTRNGGGGGGGRTCFTCVLQRQRSFSLFFFAVHRCCCCCCCCCCFDSIRTMSRSAEKFSDTFFSAASRGSTGRIDGKFCASVSDRNGRGKPFLVRSCRFAEKNRNKNHRTISPKSNFLTRFSRSNFYSQKGSTRLTQRDQSTKKSHFEMELQHPPH